MQRPILLSVALCFHWFIAFVVLFIWRKVDTPRKLIILLLLLIGGSSALEFILVKLGKHNLWVTHVSTLVELLLISAFFFIWSRRKRKYFIIVAVFIFSIVWIISKFTFESFNQYDSYTSGLARILEIIYAISLLFDVFDEKSIPILKDGRFWIASGVLTYSTGVVLIFTTFNDLFKESIQMLRLVWQVNWILSILSSIMYLYGILCKEPKDKNFSPAPAGTIKQSQAIHQE